MRSSRTHLMMRIGVLLMLLLYGCGNYLYAKDEIITYDFQIVDSITRCYVADPEVLAFQGNDSVVVAEGMNYYLSYGDDLVPEKRCMVKVPRVATEYRIVIDAEGYCTRTVHVKVGPKDHETINLGEIGLQRLPVKLNEVTVTASKIKMYYRGDTLVYNADAFLLPDGSMLDDLLRKLDGVTIDRFGQIYCNGRRVETLMLEGRNLFDGNPRTLLENLGAYTVNKIKVFEHTDEHESLVGYSSKKEKPLAMDVVLKKQYSIGKWVNIDAGYGTHNRYLARGFGLGFTRTLALSAFVNINNLSTESNPVRNDFWDPEKARMRDSSFLNGGLSYQYDSNNRKVKIHGNVTAGSDANIDKRHRKSTTFMVDNNNYSYNHSYERTKALNVNTSHSINMRFDKAWLLVQPSFDYNRYNLKAHDVQARLDEDFGYLSVEEIENIYSVGSEQMLRKLINRSLRRRELRVNRMTGQLNVTSTVVLPPTDIMRHNITLYGKSMYRFSGQDEFNRQTVNYGSNPMPASDFYAYSCGTPGRSAETEARATYEMNFKQSHTVSVSYAYSYNYDRDVYDRYLLNNLDQVSLESLTFGQVPSWLDLDGVMDRANSRHTLLTSRQQTINVNGRFDWGDENIENEGAKGSIMLFLNQTLQFFDRKLNYTRPELYDTTAVSNPFLPSVRVGLTYVAERKSRHHRHYATLQWTSNPQMFNMTNLINSEDNSNPLFVSYGNPDLRYGYRHNAKFEYSFSKSNSPYQNHGIWMEYSFEKDAIDWYQIYNPINGVTTTSIGNVDGSRRFNVGYRGSGTIYQWESGFANYLSYSVEIAEVYFRNASLTGVSASEGVISPGRRFVYTNTLHPFTTLSFDFGRLHNKLLFTYGCEYARYRSDEPGYAPSDYRSMSYSLDAIFSLPHNFKISSKLLWRTRHDNSGIDENNWIWNMSASWHWKKPHLTFMVDAIDVLGQNSAMSYYANALGRTESWMNTLPSYVLFRVRYHIDLSPGR